jgi:uncharacterized membrane protein YhaH (DUF805 family)
MMFQPLRKYAEFEGRARRSEYWLFQLFFWGVVVALYVVMSIISVIFIQPSAVGPDTTVAADDPGLMAASIITLVMGGAILIFFVAMFIPSLALRVRRLHDIGLSGWMILIGVIPFVGGLALFIMSVLDGSIGRNTFGEDPKGRGQPRVADTFS